MIRSLLAKLTQPAPDPFDDADARLAIAALLVRLARSDHQYETAETDAITHILSQRYGLSQDDAIELRREAELLEEAAPDTVRFTNTVKEAVPLEDRLSVVEAAWSVVLADGTRSVEEDALMRMIPRFLGITDLENNHARLRAAELIEADRA
ncbi:TerB family tellurite resistance protein [uncultured Aliiroseovarius sp.]|uniref:tellurite resistance TerB family protein n=1 Tax=uncultured Aliiroseovarius sp. TaxID=1658783 RepID=UPI0026120F1B|nr:TerB family tellurite resistance protein [uncultured Aliiroseovarius sp.]